MRIHLRLRDDLRLWGWAFAGAALLFAVIVVLGVAPSPFASVGTGQASGHRTVVVPDLAMPSAMTNHRPLRTTTPAQALPKRRNVGATGTSSGVAHPTPSSTQRPTPSPIKPTQTPGAPGKPNPASSPATSSTPPAQPNDPSPTPVPVPTVPDPTSVVPSLPSPPVTVPPLPDPTDAVPPLPVP